MRGKNLFLFGGVFLISILLISVVSAGFLSDIFGKMTGNVVSGNSCIDSDGGKEIYVNGKYSLFILMHQLFS